MGMISLLNFIDAGFIITLGLLLLVSGTIMLYCYRRLNLLENSLIEHGKILQNFIINYNNQLNLHTKLEGLDNNYVTNNKSNNLENKISVSDDENDENDEAQSQDETQTQDKDNKDNKDNKNNKYDEDENNNEKLIQKKKKKKKKK